MQTGFFAEMVMTLSMDVVALMFCSREQGQISSSLLTRLRSITMI